ncbi:MAG: AgmX/PglI C-terminal domain-containing protein [Woeseiaceae bacterium]
MSSEHSEQEHSLRQEVERSERELDGLEADLRAADAELEKLAQDNHRYELLSGICGSLEELDAIGAGDLFWEDGNGAPHDSRLHHARRKITEYNNEIARVESRRESIVEEINRQNLTLDYLHYDLQDVIEQAESRNNEWIVEREADDVEARLQVMPWARGCQEDERFRRSLATSMAASIAIAFLLSVIALPLVPLQEQIELPERVAKLVRQERTPPPPPEPVAQPTPEEETPEPKPVEEQPEPLPEQAPAMAENPQPDTKEQVKSKGILAFSDSIASRARVRPAAQLGSQARLTNAGEHSAGRPERMMVTTSAQGSSGGINLASISRDFGGGGGSMEGVALSRVASTIGGGDGPGRPLAGGAAAGRTDEEIQIVFDRYKAALYRLYNRALRENPTLRGQIVIKLTIEPDGSVSLCQLQSSDMGAPVLAQQVVDRVRTFDFGAKEDIVAMTIIYPIDFLPAA